PPGDDDRAPARLPPREAVHPAYAGVPPQAPRQLRPGLPCRHREPGGIPRPGAARDARRRTGCPANPSRAARGFPPALLRARRGGETQATARPSELLSALFGPDWIKPGVARIVRENVVFGAPAPGR